MSSHRYWRLVELRAYRGSALELSALSLSNGSTPISSTPTANLAPDTGSLANLQDGSVATSAAWLRTYGLVLHWDLGSAATVDNIQLSSADDPAKFLLSASLQWSDDDSTWTAEATFPAIAWPGKRSTTDFQSSFTTSSRTLLHFDGANGAKTVDLQNVVFVGDAAINTTQKKFGTASLSMAGGGNTSGADGYVEVAGPVALGTGDYTIEGWFYRTGTPAVFGSLWDFRPVGVNGYFPLVYIVGGNEVGLYIDTAEKISTGLAMASSTWTHVALCRASGVTRLFVNGVRGGVELSDTNDYPPVNRFILGASGYSLRAGGFNGFIDEFRLVAKALYTSNFTPPSTPYSEVLVRQNAVNGKSERSGITPIYIGGENASPGLIKRSKVYRVLRNFLVERATGTVTGTTKEKHLPENTPLSRRVRLYRERDGAMIAETWSDPTTGTYTFTGVDTADRYTVLTYDYLHNYRAVAADNLPTT